MRNIEDYKRFRIGQGRNFFQWLWWRVNEPNDAKQIKKASKIFIIASLICAWCVHFLLLPTPQFLRQLGLSSDRIANIGTSIGGLTAPIIGITSIVLLYITLNNQIQFNRSQNDAYEFDTLLKLIDELETEINNFSFPDYRGGPTISTDSFQNCLRCVRHEKNHPEFELRYLSRELNMIIDLSITLKTRIYQTTPRAYTSYAGSKLDALMHAKIIPFLSRLVSELQQTPASDKRYMRLFECLRMFNSFEPQKWRPGSVPYKST